jgi:hypothetical protein
MGERIYALTFLVAIAIPIALAIVTGSPGIHSTPGIWLMVLGLPGTIIGLWTESGFGGNPLLFYIEWHFLMGFFICWRSREFFFCEPRP